MEERDTVNTLGERRVRRGTEGGGGGGKRGEEGVGGTVIRRDEMWGERDGRRRGGEGRREEGWE